MRHSATDDMDMDEDVTYATISGERLRVMTRQHDPLLEEERRHDRILMALLPDYRGFDKEPVMRRSRGRVVAQKTGEAPKRADKSQQNKSQHSMKCRRYMKRVARAHGMGTSVRVTGRAHP